MSKIVVAYDGSELSKKALERAIYLAKQDKKVELNVITAIPRLIPAVYNYGVTAVTEHEAKLKNAKEIMLEVEETLNVIPNKTETYILEGNPAQAIEEFAENNNADVIVIGSRGLSGLKEMFLGSVSHHVVQKAACEVVIVK